MRESLAFRCRWMSAAVLLLVAVGGRAAAQNRAVTLTGTLIVRGTGQPIAGADVGIADGPVTTTDAKGDWTLRGVQPGRRTLGARAIGYTPRLIALEIAAEMGPVRIALSRVATALDTVRVIEARIPAARLEFEQRRRVGLGRYITAADIAKRNPVATTDLFMNFHGIETFRDSGGATQLRMKRGMGGEPCYPDVYIDGRHMLNFVTKHGSDMIDMALTPSELYAVEVYAGAVVPPQFNGGMTGCGSIVFWTKKPG